MRDLYQHFPREVSEIITSQDFKIQNLRFMLLKQEAMCKVMQTQIASMQRNHDRTVQQLNQQIAVMMEAMSMLL
jgi:predicted kinase